MRWCGPRSRSRGSCQPEDRRLPRGLPLLLAVGAVRLAGARRLAGHPLAGRGRRRDRGHRRHRVLHRRRRTRARRAADGAGARGVAAIREAVDINVACSLGMLTQEQVDELAEMGVHRYNHNLETARSYFPDVVTTHTWEERWETLRMVRDGRHGGVLRRHRRHGRDRWSSAPSSPPSSPSWSPTRSR